MPYPIPSSARWWLEDPVMNDQRFRQMLWAIATITCASTAAVAQNAIEGRGTEAPPRAEGGADALAGTRRVGWQGPFPEVAARLAFDVPGVWRASIPNVEHTSFEFEASATVEVGSLVGARSLSGSGWRAFAGLDVKGRFVDSPSTPARSLYLAQLGATYYRPLALWREARLGLVLQAALAHESDGVGPSTCAFTGISCDQHLPASVDPGPLLALPFPNYSTHRLRVTVGLLTRFLAAHVDGLGLLGLSVDVHAPPIIPGAMSVAERDAFGGETIRLKARASLILWDAVRAIVDLEADWSSGYVPWHGGARISVGPRAIPLSAFVRGDVGRVPFGPWTATSAVSVSAGVSVDLPTALDD